MKSGFYYTNPKRKKSIKPLTINQSEAEEINYTNPKRKKSINQLSDTRPKVPKSLKWGVWGFSHKQIEKL